MGIKDLFPTEEDLRRHLQSNNERYVSRLKSVVGTLEQEHNENKKYHKIGTVLFVPSLAIGLIYIVALWEFKMFFHFGWLLLMSVLLYTSFYFFKKVKSSGHLYNITINHELYKILFTELAVSGKLIGRYGPTVLRNGEAKLTEKNRWFKSTTIAPYAERKTVLKQLEQSELVTDGRNISTVGDIFTLNSKGEEVRVAELELMDVQKEVGGGKNKKKVFKGLFFSFELPNTLTHKTFVSTEGDSDGFGHQTFLKRLKGEGLEVTELEWGQFEDLLQVATTDPAGARQVLTPDFMVELYDWWKTKKQNIRISFNENRLSILFPDNNIRLGETIDEITPEAVGGYMESMAVPMLHVLHIVEDIEKRFSR